MGSLEMDSSAIDPLRIWFQKHTVVGRRPYLDSAYERHLDEFRSDNLVIDVRTLPETAYDGALPARSVV